MSHISSTTVEIDGVKARVILARDESGSEAYVRVTLNVEPGVIDVDTEEIDYYPYTALIPKP